ncbi:hypothetical protein KUTeg_017625 [Tegillarca granosa]|uniref:G kinase-anchoring protein 1 n=1 Tax=Tegillarca granosa TaxID=220873 RepID=A0ABQ9EFG5_TEGGR|nr:hypothetical protein KUTeg_017625 [Tegillarca granosa]
MASVMQSRFALLKVEDDEDEEAQSKANNKNNQWQSTNAKKRNKNKKKKAEAAENAELKNLAFAKAGSARQRTHSGGTQHDQQGHKKGQASEKQWEEWKKADEQFATDSYEKDLQTALMMSKLEYQQDIEKKKIQKTSGMSAEQQTADKKETKKKKQKDKPTTMSLDEFNQKGGGDHVKTFADGLEEFATPVIHPAAHSQSPAPISDTQQDRFFDTVEDDHYAVESVMQAKYQTELNKKEKEIEFLRATNKKLEEEFKQVKKRNKQLCVILAQGERHKAWKVTFSVLF